MAEQTSQQLALLKTASQALAEARTIDEVKSVRDKAEAVRRYARNAQMGLEIQNYAAEVKLRAERKAGKLLAQLRLRGGDRKSKSHNGTLKLSELGINRNQSSRWQKEATVPERDFAAYLMTTQESEQEITAAGLMRLASKLSSNERNGSSHGGGSHDGQGVCGSCSSAQSDGPGLGNRSADVPDTPDEIIGELRNHRALLAQILRPLYKKGEVNLRPAEMRAVGHLLAEIDALLSQLERSLRQPN